MNSEGEEPAAQAEGDSVGGKQTEGIAPHILSMAVWAVAKLGLAKEGRELGEPVGPLLMQHLKPLVRWVLVG